MKSIENVSKKLAMSSDSSNPESVLSTKTPNKKATLSIRSHHSDKPVKRQILTSPQKPETTVKLPERFEILDECFNGLVTAIRLLKLKGSLTSFANICPKIEYLTNRIFSYDHLAQMKHIYPEAIEVKRVLKCDEETICMKPTLHINLNTDAVVLEDTSCGTKYMQLKKVFCTKLVEFYKAHPKDEIPKELLPEPFNFSKRSTDSDTISVVDVVEASKLETDGFDVKMEEEEDKVNKVIPDLALYDGTEECLSPHTESRIAENDGFDVQMVEMEKEEDEVNKVIPDSSLSDGTEDCLLPQTESRIVGTPAKVLFTPSKDLSTPIKLMSATPTLQPSRRCITMTPDDDNDSVRSTDDVKRRSSRTRCLNFDTLEEEGTVSDESNDESVDKGNDSEANGDASYDEDSLLHSEIEKPEAETEKQNLPKLVSVIHKIFQSTKRTVITKDELLHKMIACQMDIMDRKEVEEQLRLMLQLVPDWISETKASSGEFLVRINEMSTAETVRATLEEATSQCISTVS
ncbi:unnamed protein product [Eruca vesicaria subsp. sativa]|uniref:CDT1 Geminin-binding domain-containing protein n=1 Tax=Eruca vesicaria subsp. sativa TaxID=29727 RepID=A0ABC8KN84_ERUVS|nr:unnamed protein product [Eruca vesicaria subsp. sativa]